jgi:hypothetical protein
LKEKLALLALFALIIGSSITPLMAQGTLVYNIHINFFYPSCSLSNLRVTLTDQTGRVIAATTAPDVFEITLTYTTTIPTNSLTAIAFGQASFGTYSSRFVSGSSRVAVGYGGDYWTTIRMS